MKPNDFWYLMEKRTTIASLNNSLWKYPLYFRIRHELTRRLLFLAARIANYFVDKMTSIEQEQFRYTAGGDRAKYD